MHKTFFRIITAKIFFFIVLSTIILSLNLTPLILGYLHAPEGRSFALIHNNTQDFFFYQALMNEGANGSFLTYDPYTTESHQPSIIFSYFLWLGKLSKLLGLPYAITYHLLRIFLSLLFLFFIFYFLSSIKVPYPRLTFLFFLFAAPFMHTINDNGKLLTVPFMHWWNGIDPIRRAVFLPHHMAGGLLFIISIILIFKFINAPTRSHLVRLIFISATMAFVHTPSLLILLIVLPLSILIYTSFAIFYLTHLPGVHTAAWKVLRSGSFQVKFVEIIKDYFQNAKLVINPNWIIGLLAYWFIGLLFLIFMVSQTKSGFPWSQYIDWERNLQFPLDKELIGALGILFPFSLAGIISALKSKKFEYIFIACWLVVPLLLIPFAKLLNLSNIRLIQGIPYLPLAILAVLGIKSIIEFVNTLILKTGDPSHPLRVNALAPSFRGGRTRKLILFAITSIFFIFTYPTLQWSLQDQIREYWPIYGNVYLDNRLNNAFDFINNNFPAKTITLSTFYSGNYLPAYTHTVSLIGHFGYTYNEEEKEKKVQKFFKNEMTTEESKNFLSGNKITLIFQGPEEKPLYKDYLYPTLLKPVYDKEEATIYSIK